MPRSRASVVFSRGVEAPPGQHRSDAERRNRLEVIELVVDKGDVLVRNIETFVESGEVGPFVDPGLLVEDELGREQIDNPEVGEKQLGRGAVLGGGEGDLGVAGAPAQKLEEDGVGGVELEPPVGVEGAGEIALLVEMAVERRHPPGIDGAVEGVVGALVGELEEVVQGSQRDPKILGPVTQRHHGFEGRQDGVAQEIE